jgi:hypothetical protein
MTQPSLCDGVELSLSKFRTAFLNAFKVYAQLDHDERRMPRPETRTSFRHPQGLAVRSTGGGGQGNWTVPAYLKYAHFAGRVMSVSRFRAAGWGKPT